MTTRLTLRLHAVTTPFREDGGRRRERGDVPGWVLITLMTAGIVAVLWVAAEEQLVQLFREALASVRR